MGRTVGQRHNTPATGHSPEKTVRPLGLQSDHPVPCPEIRPGIQDPVPQLQERDSFSERNGRSHLEAQPIFALNRKPAKLEHKSFFPSCSRYASVPQQLLFRRGRPEESPATVAIEIPRQGRQNGPVAFSQGDMKSAQGFSGKERHGTDRTGSTQKGQSRRRHQVQDEKGIGIIHRFRNGTHRNPPSNPSHLLSFQFKQPAKGIQTGIRPYRLKSWTSLTRHGRSSSQRGLNGFSILPSSISIMSNPFIRDRSKRAATSG